MALTGCFVLTKDRCRHRRVEFGILGLVDDPHAAAAEFFEDLVLG